MSIHEDVLARRIIRYAELDSQEKGIKKEKDPLNKAIKEEMKEMNLSKFEIGEVKVSLSTQERTSMNEDALVTKLKTLGLTEAIMTVEKPNEEVISQLIYEGKLPAIELESCVEKKFVDVLKVSVKK